MRQQAAKVDALTSALQESVRANSGSKAMLANSREEQSRMAGNDAAMLGQQLAQLAGTVRGQDAQLAALHQKLEQASAANAELRSQAARAADEMARMAADRQATRAEMERMAAQFASGAQDMVAETRRGADTASREFLADAQRRQQQYLSELAALHREVEKHRADAQVGAV